MRRLVFAAFAAPLLLVTVPPPRAAGQAGMPPGVREWEVPYPNSRPRDPFVAPDGKVWFVGQAGNYLANFDPRTARFERIAIDSGTLPHNLIVDAEGKVWYAGNANGMIGRYDPVTRTITRYPMPDPTVRDPHTLIFDGKGHIYFTAQGAGRVGRLDMASGRIELVTVGQRTRPYGIVLDGRGRPFFAEFGTNKIAMIDPATMTLREYPLPDPQARPRRIAIGGDGSTVWYVDYSRGFLGRHDPATGAVTEYPSPSGPRAQPYAMTSDDKGRLWYVETGPRPNRLVAFDPAREAFVVDQPIGHDGPNTIRNMIFHAATRTIWYGADANVVGRITVPEVLRPVP